MDGQTCRDVSFAHHAEFLMKKKEELRKKEEKRVPKIRQRQPISFDSLT